MPDLNDQLGQQGVTLADRVFARLRQAIVEGEIPSGTKISEPELASEYGISRGPLRDAIGRLEACHLVERRPNVGARVVSLTQEDLLELYLLREALEGMAARLAAERMSGRDIDELRKLLRQHQERAELQEGIAYFQTEGDLDFHYRIIKASGNVRLIKLLCDDLYHLMRMYRFQFGMASSRALIAFREHGHIVEAIADRDPEMAELIMRRHIRSSRINVELLFDEKAPKGARATPAIRSASADSSAGAAPPL
ncbi:GntR family transcriptional regulator [Ectothiorhodospira shaposhnikovii]|uniref:GntR family transcriptional regulator n=1 Tax=Ectothiorhodospira shaposhnikovii TaxID=1054 RepID=UPI001905306D|nr:GntR family transcriptional regulator [Ectothiorhodospira shaposhnikovii]MBK1673525.1 GntR family transcriptional regulator [Ectothiorhodospira shaposhnikovii]